MAHFCVKITRSCVKMTQTRVETTHGRVKLTQRWLKTIRLCVKTTRPCIKIRHIRVKTMPGCVKTNRTCVKMILGLLNRKPFKEVRLFSAGNLHLRAVSHHDIAPFSSDVFSNLIKMDEVGAVHPEKVFV